MFLLRKSEMVAVSWITYFSEEWVEGEVGRDDGAKDDDGWLDNEAEDWASEGPRVGTDEEGLWDDDTTVAPGDCKTVMSIGSGGSEWDSVGADAEGGAWAADWGKGITVVCVEEGWQIAQTDGR
jgi:hypothetical protein